MNILERRKAGDDFRPGSVILIALDKVPESLADWASSVMPVLEVNMVDSIFVFCWGVFGTDMESVSGTLDDGTELILEK